MINFSNYEKVENTNKLLEEYLKMPKDKLDKIIGDDDDKFWALINVKKQLLELKKSINSKSDKKITTYSFFTKELGDVLKDTNFTGWNQYGLYDSPEDVETYDFCTTLYIDGNEITFNDWDGTGNSPNIRKNDTKESLEVDKVVQYIDMQLLEFFKNKDIKLPIETQDITKNLKVQEDKTKGDNTENLLSIEELENMLEYIRTQNAKKTTELRQLQLIRQKELIEQIISEQKKGKDLDAQIKEAKAKNQNIGE